MLELTPDLTQPAGWLPLVFALVMALAMLAYVILDGYDLGVGVLLRRADSEAQKDTMISSIGPFWDANETWLVLGVGVLLVAFPMAHGVILGDLYLPVALMLIALMLRGVAFDFRVKARAEHKPLWDRAFYAGSLLAGWSQGFMLGGLITGFKPGLGNMCTFGQNLGVDTARYRQRILHVQGDLGIQLFPKPGRPEDQVGRDFSDVVKYGARILGKVHDLPQSQRVVRGAHALGNMAQG